MARLALKLLYAVVLGLVGAGIVHIAVLLLVPVLTERDAWSRVAMLGDPYQFLRLDRSQTGNLLAGADPMFEIAVCRFDLADGALHVSSSGNVPYWSVAVFDRRGRVVYSFNDRTATGEAPDIVVATPAQILEMRKDMPERFAESIFVESELTEGMIAVRSFVPDPTWRPIVDRFLDDAACTSA